MVIRKLDDYIAATKHNRNIFKLAITSVIGTYSSVFAAAGSPGAGTLAAGNTANGIVPTNSNAGYVSFPSFTGQPIISRFEWGSSVSGRWTLYDRLFVAGAYTFNASMSLTSQPVIPTERLGATTNYEGLELWVEQVTAATGNQAVNVGYTNDAGVSSRSTGAVGVAAAPIVGRCWQLPLQSGDKGIQRIDSVTGTVASAGTFNVMILRPLLTGRVVVANFGGTLDLFQTGAPIVGTGFSPYILLAPDTTSTGIFEANIEVADG